MDFGQALDELLEGHALTREGWNGAGQRVKLAPGGSKVGAYFILYKPDGFVQPGWVPSTGDLLAKDWSVFKVQS